MCMFSVHLQLQGTLIIFCFVKQLLQKIEYEKNISTIINNAFGLSGTFMEEVGLIRCIAGNMDYACEKFTNVLSRLK